MKPFSDYPTHSVFNYEIEKTINIIKGLDNLYVLKASKTELEDFYINNVLFNPICLHSDKKYMEFQVNAETKDYTYEIPYNVIKLRIPFEGDKELWKIKPSSFFVTGYPNIEILSNEIVLTYKFRDNSDDQNRLKDFIERDLNFLMTMVSNLEKDILDHNQKAPNLIKQVINQKIETAKNTTDFISSLGIPIKKTDEPPMYSIPAIRKPQPISMPKVSTEKYESEPFLEEKEYQYILEILQSMSLVIERSPKSFSSLDEEAIRDHFLLQLNGHYQGGATGETFNASGKTDVLIREKDKNVFIAECKFWHGQKEFSEAIDQLLSYLTWRDSKTALLIFNKNRDSKSVLDKMNETMEEHSCHRKTEYVKNKKGWSRYIFVKDSEPGKEIIITTLLFDVPKEK